MDCNRAKEKKLQDETRNLMAHLPNEIALDIVSRLPISSLIQFRFVCQTWNLLTRDSRLVDLHLSRALKINPCLIFKTYHPQKEQLFFVELSDRYDDEHTLREIQIPFSTSMPYKLQYSPGVLVCGRLHWVTRFNWHLDRLIVAFDLSNDTFQEVPRPDFTVDLSHCSYHLAALRGYQFNIGASSIVSQDLRPSYDIWRTSLQYGTVTVMCHLNNGDILLDCQGGVLIAYSIDKKTLKSISISCMPKSCKTIAHVGSLNWIDNLA